MNLLLHTLLLSVLLCLRACQAFAPLLKTFPASSQSALARAPTRSATVPAGSRSRGQSRDATTVLTRLGMMFGRGRNPPPTLSEEDLATMAKSREEANQKIENFLEKRRADRKARKEAEQAEQREKVANRMKAEKEEAEHSKVYIPQRLEEIEREQAVLKDRMSAFNTKIKDKDIGDL
ncbi:unnamed protein product [Ectocarpus sp. CCAP 1310/34]|nr:unnamed protein product [Ectocarpus sp. CCAP 1310/34]